MLGSDFARRSALDLEGLNVFSMGEKASSSIRKEKFGSRTILLFGILKFCKALHECICRFRPFKIILSGGRGERHAQCSNREARRRVRREGGVVVRAEPIGA